MINADFLLWQLADSAFPTGGFAHSSGLEAARALGLVDRSSLAAFITDALVNAAHASLPFVTAVHAGSMPFGEADELCDATLPTPAANRASRTQGAALVAAAASSFELEALRLLKSEARRSGAFLHLAPVTGLVAKSLQIPLESAQRLHLFMVLRGHVSTAIRLGLVGPMEGQKLQHHLAPHAERERLRCAGLHAPDAATTHPLLDLAQGHHDRLYSRMFAT